MVKNYEKACHDLTEKSVCVCVCVCVFKGFDLYAGSSVCISMMTDEIVCLLKELPSLVKEDKSKLLNTYHIT